MQCTQPHLIPTEALFQRDSARRVLFLAKQVEAAIDDMVSSLRQMNYAFIGHDQQCDCDDCLDHQPRDAGEALVIAFETAIESAEHHLLTIRFKAGVVG